MEPVFCAFLHTVKRRVFKNVWGKHFFDQEKRYLPANLLKIPATEARIDLSQYTFDFRTARLTVVLSGIDNPAPPALFKWIQYENSTLVVCRH